MVPKNYPLPPRVLAALIKHYSAKEYRLFIAKLSPHLEQLPGLTVIAQYAPNITNGVLTYKKRNYRFYTAKEFCQLLMEELNIFPQSV